MTQNIIIKNAYANNLKNIDVEIPQNKMVILTGLSGSGKSSLAFDIIDNESRRQYMESLGMITDGVSKAECEYVKHLPPSISVVQHLNNKNPRSTVGTVTEIYTYVRLLYAKLGMKDGKKGNWQMSEFSFNKADGACRRCTGIGEVNEIKISKLIDSEKSILDYAVKEWDIHYIERNSKVLIQAAKHFSYDFNIHDKISDYNETALKVLLEGTESEFIKSKYKEVKAPKTLKEGKFEGLITNMHRRYSEKANNKKGREKLEQYFEKGICPDCNGMRLKKEVREVTLGDKTIVEVQKMSLKELDGWLSGLKGILSDSDYKLGEPMIQDMRSRIAKFLKVKVGYLSLIRSLPTLSNGEAQRLKIANLLSSGLSGVLYILDEPTKGLHGKDIENVLEILRELKDQGNHLLIIEHTRKSIKSGDYILDMGPKSGSHGGEVVAAGTLKEILNNKNSITGKYLNKAIQLNQSNMDSSQKKLVMENVVMNNVDNVTVEIPLNRMVGVVGVSGSGKSSLFIDVLATRLTNYYKTGQLTLSHCTDIKGLSNIKGIKVVNQNVIGRSSRSNPATYTKIYDDIRKAFAKTTRAVILGLNASSFSFNSANGQCENCKGTGQITTKMHFLPDVKVICPACHGKRFKKEVLEVEIHEHNISDILNLTITEANELFKAHTKISRKLDMLEEVGVGYLKLGQEFSTLSGGEMQRIKLAQDLIDDDSRGYLYIFDEPSSGLHFADTERLIHLFRKIVKRGNSVIVIEHNPEFISACDHLIELGPESGMDGGQIVFEGAPNQIVKYKESPTGQYLSSLIS